MTNGRQLNENRIDQQIEKMLLNLPDYVAQWHLNLKASRKTAATRKEYVGKIKLFLSFINTNTADVSPSDINERIVTEYFLSTQTRNGMPTSDSYQGTVWSCLNSFLGYLVKHNMIKENYMQYIDRPANRDLDRINEKRVLLTKRDFTKILRAVGTEKNHVKRARDMAIIKLFMNTGMRETALSNIMMDDVNLTERTVVVIDKGNKRHTYELNENMCNTLNDWIEVRGRYNKSNNDNHLFLSDHGKGIGGRTIIDLVEQPTYKALGKKLSPHKLRSGFCSILYKETGDIEFVRRAVGHSNVATTQRYIVTNGSERKRAAEIMSAIT